MKIFKKLSQKLREKIRNKNSNVLEANEDGSGIANTERQRRKRILKKKVKSAVGVLLFCFLAIDGIYENITEVKATNFASKVVNIGGPITLEGNYTVTVWRSGNTVYCKTHVYVAAPNGAWSAMGAQVSANKGSASNTFVGNGSATPKAGSGDVQFSFTDAGAGTVSGTIYAGFMPNLNGSQALTASFSVNYSSNTVNTHTVTYDTNGGYYKEPYKNSEGRIIIPDGNYTLQHVWSKKNKNLNQYMTIKNGNMSSGTGMVITKNDPSSAQSQWTFERYKDTSYYYIINVKSGKAIGLNGYPQNGSLRDKAVEMYNQTLNEDDYLWYLREDGPGEYYIINKHTRQGLTARYTTVGDGNLIFQYGEGNDTSENTIYGDSTWYFNKVGEEVRTKAEGATFFTKSSIPVRTGYTFKYWSSSKDFATTWDGKNWDFNSTILDRAYIRAIGHNKYEVLAHTNGSIGEVSAPTWTMDGNQSDIVWYKLYPGTWERDGHTYNWGVQVTHKGEFAGTPLVTHFYSYYSNGSGQAAAREYGRVPRVFMSEGSYTYDQNGGNAILYANWYPKTVKTTFHRNFNSSDTTTATHTYTAGAGQSFSTNGWSRQGYTLLGWSHSSNAKTATYTPTNGIGDGWIEAYSSSTDLYAVWKKNSYQQTVRVRFENADGSFTGYSQAYQANHNYGSTFNWEFPASQQYQSAKVSYKVTGAKSTDVTVYRKKYTVKALARYQNKDGSWPSEYKEEYNKTYRYGEECPDYPKFVNTASDYSSIVSWKDFTVTEDKVMKFDLALDKGSVTVKVYLNGVRKELDNDYFKFDYYVENKLIASQVNSVEDKKSFYKSNFIIKNITPIPGYHYDNKYVQKSWMPIPPVENNTGIIDGVLNKDSGNKYILYISANQYTISYNPNKGSGSMSPDTVTYNTAYKTKKNTFTRTGYTFNGWNEKADGTGTAWSLSSSGVYEANKTWTWTYTHDITLYAQWKPNNYTYNIKYVSSSGKDLGHDTVTGAFDTSKTVTPPNKAGYTTPAAQTVTFDSTTAKTITFVYPLIDYTISYDVNGGAALSNPRTSYNVESSAYTLPVTSRIGYTFTGWTGSNGTTPQKSVTIAAGSTGNKSYKANWEANTYTNTIHHWATGFKKGEGNSTDKTEFKIATTSFTKKYNEKYNIDDSFAVKAPNGFILQWYFKTDSLPKKADAFSKPYTVTQPANNIIANFYYSPQNYSISYNLNGGTNSSYNPSTYNVLYGVSLENPTKAGYTFLGWYEGDKKVTGINEGANATFSSGDDLYAKLSARKTGNVTLAAKWKANSLTIRYHSNGAFGGNKYENSSWKNDIVFDYGQSTDTVVYIQNLEEGSAANSGLQTYGVYDYSWKRKNDIYMYKNGYIGTGKYNTKPNSSGIEIDENKTFNSVIELANYLGKSIDSKDNSIDLYPQWKAISYSIAYNGNGATSGSMSEQPATFDKNGELTPNSFSRKYTVTYNATGGTVNAPNNVATSTFNGWEDRGNITFIDKNYSYNEFDAPYYSQNYTDLNTAFGFNKYDLIKHYFLYGKSEGRNTKDKAGNAGLYPNKATVKNLTTTNGYKVNLYASWKLGSVTLPTPTRFGYKFLGWYTSAEGGTKISGTTYTPTSNVTLYAHWKLDSYYIDYNVNDAGLTDHITDNLPDNNGSLPGKDTAAMLTDFALQKGSKYNTKYTFKEWNTKPDGSGKKFTTSITNDGSLCKPGETLTLYAIWDTTPIMSAKDFYLIEEVPAPNDVVYSGVGFDKTPTEKYPDKLSEVAYPIKGYTKNGTDISSRIKVDYVEYDGSKTATASIDTKKPGKYIVHYSLVDGKQTKKFTRTITVLSASTPVINAGDRYFNKGSFMTAEMLLSTITSGDRYDGNLTNKVAVLNMEQIAFNTVGSYELQYKVTNRSGKTVVKKVKIHILEYLTDNQADKDNKYRYIRKDCSTKNDYCMEYFKEDSKWVTNDELNNQIIDSLSKDKSEEAIKKYHFSQDDVKRSK